MPIIPFRNSSFSEPIHSAEMMSTAASSSSIGKCGRNGGPTISSNSKQQNYVRSPPSRHLSCPDELRILKVVSGMSRKERKSFTESLAGGGLPPKSSSPTSSGHYRKGGRRRHSNDNYVLYDQQQPLWEDDDGGVIGDGPDKIPKTIHLNI